MFGHIIANHIMSSNESNCIVGYKEFMNALFWDLNVACYFPKVMQGKPEEIDWEMFNNMNASLSKFIHETFEEVNHQITHFSREVRTGNLYHALDFLGWKMFAICAHSEAFRATVRNMNHADLMKLVELIANEERCIEIFARSRDLDWRGPLLYQAGGEWPGLRDVLAPNINLATQHPHHIVQTTDGGLRQPVYPWTKDGKLQASMQGNYVDPNCPNQEIFKRQPNYPACFLCDRMKCECDPMFVAGDFIELREYPNKGVGTRALANLPAKTWIGEFNGVLCGATPESNIFSMTYAAPVIDEDGRKQNDQKEHIVVDPTQYGSWTRFCNHHCDQENATVTPSIAGDRAMLAVYSRKDISVFDEVTINYGPGYWGRGRVCGCGSKNCVSTVGRPLWRALWRA